MFLLGGFFTASSNVHLRLGPILSAAHFGGSFACLPVRLESANGSFLLYVMQVSMTGAACQSGRAVSELIYS